MNSKQLISWRKKQKLTQQEACVRFQVKVDTWRKWEQGKNPIPALLEIAIGKNGIKVFKKSVK